MFYRLAADFAVFIHFLWIVFLLVGAFIGRRYHAIKVIHISGLIFSIVMQIFGWYCPLTYLELWLRQKHDPSVTYSGSFIVHYIGEIVYLELSPLIIFVLTLILAMITGYIYSKRGFRTKVLKS